MNKKEIAIIARVDSSKVIPVITNFFRPIDPIIALAEENISYLGITFENLEEVEKILNKSISK